MGVLSLRFVKDANLSQDSEYFVSLRIWVAVEVGKNAT